MLFAYCVEDYRARVSNRNVGRANVGFIRLFCLLYRRLNLLVSLIGNAGLLTNALRLRLMCPTSAYRNAIRVLRLLTIADRSTALFICLARNFCRTLRLFCMTILGFRRLEVG